MLLAGSLAAALLLALAWWATRPAADEGGAPVAASRAATRDATREALPTEVEREADRAAAPHETPSAGPLLLPRREVAKERDLLAAVRPGRFEGRGSIEVHCRAAEGCDFPALWTLEAGPAPALIGGERADSRVVELEGNAGPVLLEDLALGGYELRASAPGMRSEPALCMLSLPGHTEAAVELVLRPAGFLSGSLVTPDGRPVAALEVTLAAQLSGEVLRAETDAVGVFRFNGVWDGAYRLLVGDPRNPLVPPRQLDVRAPLANLEPIELPPLCELELRVVDDAGFAVADASVQGWSTGGGRIDGETDAFGLHRARFLPEGEYTVVASHATYGRGRGRATLHPNQPVRTELALER